ncbi:MAG: two-component system sensor histidine kinase NtrB [Syntrophales bacterium]
MNSEENITRLRGAHRFKLRFIQPFAVILVSAIFIILILTMGLIDMRRSERMLSGFIEDQGRRVIGVVEKLTEENLKNMIAASQKTQGSVTISLKESIFSPDTLLTEKIIAMGREIDNHWKKEHISGSYISEFAREKNIWLVAVLNAAGNVIFQSRPVAENLRADVQEKKNIKKSAAALIKGLNTLNRQKKIGFIAMSRKDKSGTIILALDRESMRYWGMRVSVERAIEKLGEGQGLLYLAISDDKGHDLGSIGYMPGEVGLDDSLRNGILSGARRFESRKTSRGENSVQEITAPFYLGKEILGVIILGLDRGNTDKILMENRRNVYLFLVFVIASTLLSLWLLYHNQNRHLGRVVEMTRQLEKAERLSSLGMLAAGVAHEIRNPLNAISMASQRLKREFPPSELGKKEEFDTITTVIRDEIRRLNGIIEEFLTFSKSRRLELRDNAVQDVLQKIVNLVSPEALAKGVIIRTDWQEDPIVIPMDMDKLQQALLNFVKNAVESISGAGDVTLAVRKEEKGLVKIVITDTGCGLTAEEVERIFNPEYTTKEKGLGLGLSLAHEIIRGHGGEIRVRSQRGEGTVFEIFMPMERLNEKAAAK